MMICHGCKGEKQTTGDRVPRGWKRIGEVVLCSSCWGDRYVLRAVTFPVASSLDCTWAELWRRLSEVWRSTTAMSNWAMTRIRAVDPANPADSEQEKIPRFIPPYIYPEARALWPEHPTQSVISVLQTAQRRYMASRFDVAWRFAAALPTFRYPVPYPVHNRGWAATFDAFGGEDGAKECPVVSLRLGGERIRLRLRGGSEFRRQLAAFREIASGDAVQGELAIYPETQRGSNTRRTVATAGANGGGQRTRHRIMVKLVAWLPRKARGHRQGTLHVRTDETAFVVAVLADPERVWTMHADLVARWQAEHSSRLQHLADDQKLERRRPRKSRERFQVARRLLVAKHRDRMDSWIQQSARQIAGFAARQRVAEVRLDLSTMGRFQSFPWYRWVERLRTVLDEERIGLVVADPVTADPSSGDAVT